MEVLANALGLTIYQLWARVREAYAVRGRYGVLSLSGSVQACTLIVFRWILMCLYDPEHNEEK